MSMIASNVAKKPLPPLQQHLNKIISPEKMTATVTLIVACTLQNYIVSNCVPPELLKMPVEMCYYNDNEK